MGVNTVIVATGSYIPTRVVRNSDYLTHTMYPDGTVIENPTVFYDADGNVLSKPTSEIISKFEGITGIFERRYVRDGQTIDEIAALAAKDALYSSGISPDSLDGIIVAQNFIGLPSPGEFVPSVASRVRQRLGITNPNMNNYDLTAACPGWLKAVLNANDSINSGRAKRILVIGAEIISCLLDPHDENRLLFGDGAGALVIEAVQSELPAGVISYIPRSDTLENAFSLSRSFNKAYPYPNKLFVKMNGRKVYSYFQRYAPGVIKESIEMAGLHIDDIKMVFMHQANEKMIEEALERLYKLYDRKVPGNVMPMTISWLGNSSVATIPTLMDFVFKKKFGHYKLSPGDYIVIASVGAGMNIDSAVYRLPKPN